jgi:hypothetical protein
MENRSNSSIFWDRGYIRQARRPLNCLLFIILPLALYQAFALKYGTQLLAPQDLAKLMAYFGAGASAALLPPALIVVVLLAQHFFERRAWVFQPTVLLGMLAESAAWVLPMLALSYFTRQPMTATTSAAPSQFARQALQGLGAGIYEEFIFRLMLAGLILFVLAGLLEFRRDASAVVAIFAQAALFSLYHLSHAQVTGEAAFPWSPFVFRMLAGAYLGALFILRGYGITVGTHAVWNLYVAWISIP